MTSYDIIVGLPDTTAVPPAWKVQADICCRADNIGGKGLQEGPPDLSFFYTQGLSYLSWGFLRISYISMVENQEARKLYEIVL